MRFQRNFCLPQISMSVQKMLICVKTDSVWMSLVHTVVSVRWDSLPPWTASHAKVNYWYFKFIFWVWIGCHKANNENFWKYLNLEAEYVTHASHIKLIYSTKDYFAVLIMLKVAFISLWSFPGCGPEISAVWLGNFVLVVFFVTISLSLVTSE